MGQALALGRGAVEAGAEALLIMPAIHPYMSDVGFRDYVDALSTDLPLPLFAYKNAPVPSDGLLLEMCGDGRLAGIKYAINDVDAVRRLPGHFIQTPDSSAAAPSASRRFSCWREPGATRPGRPTCVRACP